MKRYINKFMKTIKWVDYKGEVEYQEIVMDVILTVSIAIHIICIYLLVQVAKG